MLDSQAPPSPEIDAFLDAATEPLSGNAELRINARNFLFHHWRDGAAPPAPEALARPRVSICRLLVLLILTLALLIPLIHAGWQFLTLTNLFRSYVIEATVLLREKLTPPVTPKQDLQIFGDPQYFHESKRWKKAVEQLPDNPAVYAYYANDCLRITGKLPDDFDQTIARIDPDNGYFQLLKAHELTDQAVPINSLSPRSRSKTLSASTIADPPKFQQAFEIYLKASSYPVFQSYEKTWFQTTAQKLPLQADLVEIQKTRHLIDSLDPSSNSKGQILGLFFTHLEKIVNDRDIPAFRQLVDCHVRLHQAANQSSTIPLLERMALLASLTHGVYRFAEAATTLNQPDIEQRFRLISTSKFKIDSYIPSTISQFTDFDTLAEQSDRKSQEIINLAMLFKLPNLSIPPDLLTAGRRAEHGFAARGGSLATSAILLALALLMLIASRFRQVILRKTTPRLLRLLTTTDRLWILSLGTVLPFACFLANRFSKWGQLDWSINSSEAILAAQWISLMFSILLATTLALSWRLKQRLHFLDFKPSFFYFTLAVLLINLGTLPLLDYWRLNRGWPEESYLIPLFPSVIWLIIILTRTFFFSHLQSLSRALIHRAMPLSLLLSAILMSSSYFGFYAEERYWVAHDPINRSPTTMKLLDNLLASQLQQHTQQILDQLQAR